MDEILKLGHIDKAFFRDIAKSVDGLVGNPVNKKHFSEQIKTFRKKREHFFRATTKRREAAGNSKLQLSEEEHKKGLAGEDLRPPQKGWVIGYRHVQKTSPLMKALSDANIDSHLLSRLRYSSPLLMKARSDSIKGLLDLNIDSPSLRKELSDANVEPDLDECIKVLDIIKATRPDLADSNFDARNASPLMVIRVKIASALSLDERQSWTDVYFWMPPLPFDLDSWLSYHYEPGKQGGSPRPERPESKVDRIACQYALFAVIHDYGLEELASDEWLTTTDEEQWAKPLWTKVSTSTLSPDDPDERERKTRIEEALAMVKADLASLPINIEGHSTKIKTGIFNKEFYYNFIKATIKHLPYVGPYLFDVIYGVDGVKELKKEGANLESTTKEHNHHYIKAGRDIIVGNGNINNSKIYRPTKNKDKWYQNRNLQATFIIILVTIAGWFFIPYINNRMKPVDNPSIEASRMLQTSSERQPKNIQESDKEQKTQFIGIGNEINEPNKARQDTND